MAPELPSSRLRVRRASADDAAAIAALHVRSWQWAYRGLLPDSYLDGLGDDLPRRVKWWSELLSSPKQWIWVAEAGDEIVGFAGTSPSWDEDADASTAMLGSIYLERAAVRQGIGRSLLERAVDNLRVLGYDTVTLWVLDTNERARQFYEALGWQPDGVTKVEQRPGFQIKELRYRLDLRAPTLPRQTGRT